MDKSVIIKNAKKTGMDSLLELGGFCLAHIATKATKQENNALIAVATLGAGAAGEVFVEQSAIQSLCKGVKMYGGIKTLNIGLSKIVGTETQTAVEVAAATNNVAADKSVKGLGSIGKFLPDSFKDTVRKFIPSINGPGEANNLLGDDELEGALKELGLEKEKQEQAARDRIMNGIGNETDFEEMNGIGSPSPLLTSNLV